MPDTLFQHAARTLSDSSLFEGLILKKLEAILNLVGVPLLLSIGWTLVLFAVTRKFHWRGFAILDGLVTLIYWLEIAKGEPVVDAAMTTFVTTLFWAAITGVVLFIRAH